MKTAVFQSLDLGIKPEPFNEGSSRLVSFFREFLSSEKVTSWVISRQWIWLTKLTAHRRSTPRLMEKRIYRRDNYLSGWLITWYRMLIFKLWIAKLQQITVMCCNLWTYLSATGQGQISRYNTRRSGFDHSQGQGFFLFARASIQTLRPPSLLSDGYWGLFLWG